MQRGHPVRAERPLRRHLAEPLQGSVQRDLEQPLTLLPYELSIRHPDWLHVEPVRSFFHHGPSREGIETLFRRRDDDFEGIYSMHLWSHLWWSWRRRDFSRFSALQLTERYVRKAETTFALAARPFLPPKKKTLFGPR